MNLAALSGVDPDDLTQTQRLALFAAMVADREARHFAAVRDGLCGLLANVPVRPRSDDA